MTPALPEIARIFIGYDSRIPVAFGTLAHSITAHASMPVAVTPLNLRNLAGVFRRPPEPLQSTEFSFSRFLVPFLSGFQGWSLFMDNDIVVRCDIAELWALRDETRAVMVVQHDHDPAGATKFLGAAQTRYARKNWSSVMLFNNARCRALTPDYVSTAPGLDLHQFRWLADDALIGALPPAWNYLAGYTEGVADPAAVHYTEGGPWYPDYAATEYAADWLAAFEAANHCATAPVAAIAALAEAARKGRG